MRLTILLILLLWFSQRLSAQSNDSLIHYSVENGLPSNFVFRTTEDSKGFIWFLTNRGIARFDGYGFKYFTTADGLPNNGVFAIGEDSYQRIWLNASTRAFVYFDMNKNKFCSIPNTTDAPKSGFFDYIYEAENGGLVFNTNTKIVYELDKNLKIVSWKKRIDKDIYTYKNYPKVSRDIAMYAFEGNSTYSLVKGVGLPQEISHFPSGYAISRVLMDSTFFYLKGLQIVAENHGKRIIKDIDKISRFGNTLNIQIFDIGAAKRIIVKTDKEVFIVNNELERLPEFDFINKFDLNLVFFDSKDNLWISTSNNGVFQKVKKKERISQNVFLKNQTITALTSDKKGNLFIGNSRGELFIFRDSTVRKLDFKNAPISGVTNLQFNAKGNLFVSWEDVGYSIIPSAILYQKKAFSIESILDLRPENTFQPFYESSDIPFSMFKISLVLSADVRTYGSNNNGDILIAVNNNIRILKDLGNHWSNQIIIKNLQAVSITNSTKNQFWVSNLDHFFLYKNNKIDSLSTLNSKVPGLTKNLNPIVTDLQNNVWFSHARVGLFYFNTFNYQYERIEELSNNFVENLKIDAKNRLWIITNKGVCLLEKTNDVPFKYRFVRIDKTNGLISNEIECINVDDSTLYVGTSKGLSMYRLSTILGQKKLQRSDIPLHFSNLKINQKDTILRGSYDLRYDENNLEIDFAGHSFDPQNPIRYEYRMQKDGETNVEWRTTNEPHLDFYFLPAGKYTLHVRAFDAENRLLEMEQPLVFNVRLPFWKTGWFLGSIFAFLGLGTWFWYQNNIKQIQREEAAKAEISRQFTVLELQALQAQMNPHFVFNALTAIQNFIWNKDVKVVNEYLTEFSTLMRLFLESSRRKYLTVEEEVKLLKIYVHLEQLRFPDRFDVDFDIDENINPSDELPSMLIQPFVENAINHGLLYKKEKGLLQVHFSKENNILTCIVEDNGVGRDAAAVKQAKSMKAHKSRATEILQERIALMKSAENMEVTVNIEDKNLENLQDFGTKVLIEIKEL
jgi:ligand-binding sensor domain-containing protein